MAFRRDPCERRKHKPLSKDVIVVTEKDVAAHRSNPSLIIKPALEEGGEIYAAA